MTVYHGTTKAQSDMILRDGLIKITNEETTHYPHTGCAKTTYGFVYVTTSINEALNFALTVQASPYNAEQYPVIFEIDIPEEETENDEDEEFHRASSALYTVPENSSKRISRNLFVGGDVIRYAVLRVPNYKSGCNWVDSEKFIDAIQKKFIPLKSS